MLLSSIALSIESANLAAFTFRLSRASLLNLLRLVFLFRFSDVLLSLLLVAKGDYWETCSTFSDTLSYSLTVFR